ncbi:accessory gene regulator ArgB-like protein [uncultured Eubacterium sp.]|uniref:accessory gene regulator ArgB-like protein n=1 Tax=uncultured Eubacterium sp. TaxID=165185 RepID=UPI0025FA10A0|nr:accessory gene regulator B family protein [uncultured Eubacterium sp.]
MIFRCSGKIARHLCLSEIISEDEYELYQYAVFSIMSTIIPLIMVMTIGGILGLMKNGIVMIIPFLTIRKFCGGFHAKREWICILLSVIVVTVCIILTTYCKADIWLNGGVIGSVLTISVFSPVVSVNRDIPKHERVICRKIAIILTVTSAGNYFVLRFWGYSQFAVCIAIGIILTAVLQDLAWIQQKLILRDQAIIER